MTDQIYIGKINTTHGIKGELKVRHAGDILADLELPCKVDVRIQNTFKELTIIGRKVQPKNLIIQFANVDKIEIAMSYVNAEIYISKNKIPVLELAEGEFYTYQLIGLCPMNNGKIFSEYKIIEVLDNPAHPILVISSVKKEFQVPYIGQFIGEINIENQTIEILNWKDWH